MTDGSQVPRSHVLVLVLCAAGVIAHQLTHWNWFIEDAAICFAYARNLVSGEGLVPFPGGERVEAYSNPTWIGVLALFQAIGIDGFTIAKPLAMALGCLNVGIVWRLARRAMPSHTGPGALFAPVALAVSSQYAIWSASGLENAWFCTLLGALILRTVHEAEHGGRPWAAVLALTLTWTRPEAILYAAVAGAAYLLGCWRSGRGLRPVAIWLGVFWIPTVLLESARLAYFAWPLPNTFYAKVGDSGTPVLGWDSRGWMQLRTWADRLWVGYQTPLYVLGLTGVRGPRARVAVGVMAVLGLSLLWPGPVELQAWRWWPALPEPPSAWITARVLALLAAGAALPLLTLQPTDDPRARAAQHVRLLCGGTWFVSILFSVASDGDWMGGYRWMSLGVVPAVVLLAVGLTSVLEAVHDRVHRDEPGWGTAPWLIAALVTATWLPPNLSQTWDHLFHNTDETPQMIHDRVDYMRQVARTTFLDEDPVVLDIDMGAFLWWGHRMHMLDVAKLIDVPMARHFYQQRAFVDEYLHVEHPFHFANIGIDTFWSRSTGLATYPWWREEYFELPGYYTARGLRFIGMFARRDLIMAPRGELTGPRRTPFAQQLVLEDVKVPAPWTTGQDGYLEAPWATNRVRPVGSEVRVLGFLATADQVVATWDLPLGYGLYPLDGWRPAEVFRGKHAVPIPPDLPAGSYTLGFVVFAPEGHVWPALEPPRARPSADGTASLRCSPGARSSSPGPCSSSIRAPATPRSPSSAPPSRPTRLRAAASWPRARGTTWVVCGLAGGRGSTPSGTRGRVPCSRAAGRRVRPTSRTTSTRRTSWPWPTAGTTTTRSCGRPGIPSPTVSSPTSAPLARDVTGQRPTLRPRPCWGSSPGARGCAGGPRRPATSAWDWPTTCASDTAGPTSFRSRHLG